MTTSEPLFPDAVLWDMDGTLIDTERYWITAEHALVAEYGGTWTIEHAHAVVGKDLRDTARYLQMHGDVTLPTDKIVERLMDGVIAGLREEAPFMPGATALPCWCRPLSIDAWLAITTPLPSSAVPMME